MSKEEGGSPIILVVEDVEETRDCIEKLLKHDGYRIETARDEDEAVERARSNPPILILICIDGTTEDVIAAARRIRSRSELRDDIALVVFCTEKVSEGAEISIRDNVYVTRPDDFNQLRKFISRLQRKLSLVPSRTVESKIGHKEISA